MSLACKRRRHFFKQVSGIVAMGATVPLLSNKAHATLPSDPAIKRLSLYNRHTGERTQGIFSANGVWQKDVINAFEYNLRDHRQDELTKMDPKLFEFLHKIQQQLMTDKEVHIISGYRSAKTNAMLAGKSSKVAKRSFHMQGKALDFTIPGIDLKLIRDTARSLKLGGVGYYPNSGFIHIDTAWVRNW